MLCHDVSVFRTDVKMANRLQVIALKIEHQREQTLFRSVLVFLLHDKIRLSMYALHVSSTKPLAQKTKVPLMEFIDCHPTIVLHTTQNRKTNLPFAVLRNNSYNTPCMHFISFMNLAMKYKVVFCSIHRLQEGWH